MASPTYGLLCFAQGGNTLVGPPQPSSTSPQAQATRPWLPEIHLNIWERKSKKGAVDEAFLDIGLMLDINDPTSSIELIFPWKVDLSAVEDLFAIISKPEAIPAIFNESWAITVIGSDAVVHDPNKISESFAIVSALGIFTASQHGVHDAISINVSKLISKAKTAAQAVGSSVEKAYLRIRVHDIRRDFYCVGAGEHRDDWWMPSWQHTEDIDFRLNVRRGAPPGLERAIGRFLEFSKVHLFLMRSRDKDIVFQDKLFKASRSLEDENFWAAYSLGRSGVVADNLARVQKSLGYQWKKTANATDGPVKEFGTLARFKMVEFGIGKFLLFALLLGAAGNVLWDTVKTSVMAGYTYVAPEQPVDARCINLDELAGITKKACTGRTGSDTSDLVQPKIAAPKVGSK